MLKYLSFYFIFYFKTLDQTRWFLEKPATNVLYQHKIVHQVKNKGSNNHYYITWFL
jgi:hypothetical protein